MSLVSVRAAVANFFREEFPGVDVREHGGAFDLDELKRITARTPAMFVTCLGLPSVVPQGGVVAGNVSFALFVCVSDTIKEKRDVTALTMVEAISVLLPYQRWNDTANKTPTDVQVTNLYSSTLDKQGINLWVFRWNQEVDFENDVWSTLDSLLRVYADYDFQPDDVAGRTNPEDHIDLAGP